LKPVKDISIDIAQKKIFAGHPIHGVVSINYSGRYDTIVINSQIENSNDIFNYTSLNGKKINYTYARLSIFRSEIADERRSLDFTAITKHIPTGDSSNAKFRVAIIQEHKEIASDVDHIKIAKQISSGEGNQI
jgi:hypothetical protein